MGRYFVPPQRENRNVAEIVTAIQAFLREPIPIGWQCGNGQRIREPISLGDMLIDAVGVSLGHDGGKVIIKGCPGRRGIAEEGQIGLVIIANGIEVIAARAQPVITSTLIIFDLSALVRMVGNGVITTLIIRREGKVERATSAASLYTRPFCSPFAPGNQPRK
jgi:hypothetical protein